MCTAPGAPYAAPGALHVALGLRRLLQGFCALLWGCVHCSRASAHCCHLAALLKKCSCCRSCCPLPSRIMPPAAGRLHHCHVAASVSISATATHCLCLRTHQHQPGPSRPSTDGLLLLQRLSGPTGTLITWVQDALGRCCPPSPAAGARQHPCLPRRSRVPAPRQAQRCHGQCPAVHRSFRGGF